MSGCGVADLFDIMPEAEEPLTAACPKGALASRDPILFCRLLLVVQFGSLIGAGGQFRIDRGATAGAGRSHRPFAEALAERARARHRRGTRAVQGQRRPRPLVLRVAPQGGRGVTPPLGGSSVTSRRGLAARDSTVGRGYRPMIRSSCRSRTPAGTSAITASRKLVSSGEEARAMRAAAREPSTRRRARGARSRS